MASNPDFQVHFSIVWKVYLVFIVSWVTSGLMSLLQPIPLWSLRRKGRVTDLSVPEGSVCTLCLFTSPSSSAVVVWARPGAHTVRNVPFQVQVRHLAAHSLSFPATQVHRATLAARVMFLFLSLNLVFNKTMCFCHFCRNCEYRRLNQWKKLHGKEIFPLSG